MNWIKITGSLFLLLFVSCTEKLPPRIEPQNTLSITDVVYTQGNEGTPFMEFLIVGQNNYEETFDSNVEIKGAVHIRATSDASITGLITIGNVNVVQPTQFRGNELTVDPYGKFYLRVYWYLTCEDGRNLMNILDFPQDMIKAGIMYARPMSFQIDAEVCLFKQLGYIKSAKYHVVYNGWKPVQPGGN
jgi:hypothetical protein